MALMAGLSALTGGLGNTQAARTSTSQSTNTSSGGSGTSQTLLPEQQSALGALGPLITNMISNPSSITEPIRQANVNAANGAYKGAPQAIANQFGTGAGASGVSGQAQVQSDLARRGAIQGADQAANLQTAQVQESGAGLAQQLLNHSFGSTSAFDSGGATSGSQTAAGSPIAGALGGGLSGLASMMALMGMLNGGGGSGSSANGGY
jgi:hypothetical protein